MFTDKNIEIEIDNNLGDLITAYIKDTQLLANHENMTKHVKLNLSHQYIVMMTHLLDEFNPVDNASESAVSLTYKIFNQIDVALEQYIYAHANGYSIVNVNVQDGILSFDILSDDSKDIWGRRGEEELNDDMLHARFDGKTLYVSDKLHDENDNPLRVTVTNDFDMFYVNIENQGEPFASHDDNVMQNDDQIDFVARAMSAVNGFIRRERDRENGKKRTSYKPDTISDDEWSKKAFKFFNTDNMAGTLLEDDSIMLIDPNHVEDNASVSLIRQDDAKYNISLKNGVQKDDSKHVQQLKQDFISRAYKMIDQFVGHKQS